jgi:uncharacterized FlaG/YvyC family protein
VNAVDAFLRASRAEGPTQTEEPASDVTVEDIPSSAETTSTKRKNKRLFKSKLKELFQNKRLRLHFFLDESNGVAKIVDLDTNEVVSEVNPTFVL